MTSARNKQLMGNKDGNGKRIPLVYILANDESVRERGIVSFDVCTRLWVYMLFIVKNDEKLHISNGVSKCICCKSTRAFELGQKNGTLKASPPSCHITCIPSRRLHSRQRVKETIQVTGSRELDSTFSRRACAQVVSFCVVLKQGS